jgi:hypothetical protein
MTDIVAASRSGSNRALLPHIVGKTTSIVGFDVTFQESVNPPDPVINGAFISISGCMTTDGAPLSFSFGPAGLFIRFPFPIREGGTGGGIALDASNAFGAQITIVAYGHQL